MTPLLAQTWKRIQRDTTNVCGWKIGVAEAIINDDGFVVGARILDRQRIFQELPEISIIGGGGFGAKLLASLACLDTEQLSTIGATKIGTGQYIDCP